MCGVMDMPCDLIADAYFVKKGEDGGASEDESGERASAAPKSGAHWPLPQR